MTFDFQLRPVGHYRNRGSILLSLRFKDMVSIHAQRRVNSALPISKFPKIARAFHCLDPTRSAVKMYRSSAGISQA